MWSFLRGLFGAAKALVGFEQHEQAVEEGIQKQKDAQLNGQVSDQQKEIEALQLDARTVDKLTSNPDYADELRDKLNARPD